MDRVHFKEADSDDSGDEMNQIDRMHDDLHGKAPADRAEGFAKQLRTQKTSEKVAPLVAALNEQSGQYNLGRAVNALSEQDQVNKKSKKK